MKLGKKKKQKASEQRQKKGMKMLEKSNKQLKRNKRKDSLLNRYKATGESPWKPWEYDVNVHFFNH